MTARSRNPLLDLPDLTEMHIVKTRLALIIWTHLINCRVSIFNDPTDTVSMQKLISIVLLLSAREEISKAIYDSSVDETSRGSTFTLIHFFLTKSSKTMLKVNGWFNTFISCFVFAKHMKLTPSCCKILTTTFLNLFYSQHWKQNINWWIQGLFSNISPIAQTHR